MFKEKNIQVFRSTVDQIYLLIEHDIRLGVASSRKNCHEALLTEVYNLIK